MAFSYIPFLLLAIYIHALATLSNAGGHHIRPPSPGYRPSSKFRSMSFYKGYRNLWGPNHQRLDNKALTIWLDRTSGM